MAVWFLLINYVTAYAVAGRTGESEVHLPWLPNIGSVSEFCSRKVCLCMCPGRHRGWETILRRGRVHALDCMCLCLCVCTRLFTWKRLRKAEKDLKCVCKWIFGSFISHCQINRKGWSSQMISSSSKKWFCLVLKNSPSVNICRSVRHNIDIKNKITEVSSFLSAAFSDGFKSPELSLWRILKNKNDDLLTGFSQISYVT